MTHVDTRVNIELCPYLLNPMTELFLDNSDHRILINLIDYFAKIDILLSRREKCSAICVINKVHRPVSVSEYYHINLKIRCSIMHIKTKLLVNLGEANACDNMNQLMDQEL